MVDRQRPHGRHHLRDRVERDGLVVGRLQIDLREVGRIDAEARLRLEDDLIVVGRLEDRADLPRAEGVEQLVADLIGADAVDRRLFAVDLHGHLRILDLEIVGHVQHAGNLRDLLHHLRSDRVELLRCRCSAGCIDTGCATSARRRSGSGCAGRRRAARESARSSAAAARSRLRPNRAPPSVSAR